MPIIAIEGTTKKDRKLVPLFLQHLCYGITDESGIKLDCKYWNGHSGGDGAYFGLHGTKVKVLAKNFTVEQIKKLK